MQFSTRGLQKRSSSWCEAELRLILPVVPSPMYLRPILLAILVTLLSSDSLRSQSPGCVDRPPSAFHRSPRIKINIVSVEFRGENSLSDEERSQFVESIQRSNFSVSATEPDTYWANGVMRVANETLHAQGHVGDRTKVTPYLVSAEPAQRSYAVSIEIETGPPYRVRTLQVIEATAFTPAELLDQIHLRPGERFNEDKIRQGIKSMKRLFYIERHTTLGLFTKSYSPTKVFMRRAVLINRHAVALVERKQIRSRLQIHLKAP